MRRGTWFDGSDWLATIAGRKARSGGKFLTVYIDPAEACLSVRGKAMESVYGNGWVWRCDRVCEVIFCGAGRWCTFDKNDGV